jgi:hypothetical protein
MSKVLTPESVAARPDASYFSPQRLAMLKRIVDAVCKEENIHSAEQRDELAANLLEAGRPLRCALDLGRNPFSHSITRRDLLSGSLASGAVALAPKSALGNVPTSPIIPAENDFLRVELGTHSWMLHREMFDGAVHFSVRQDSAGHRVEVRNGRFRYLALKGRWSSTPGSPASPWNQAGMYPFSWQRQAPSIARDSMAYSTN